MVSLRLRGQVHLAPTLLRQSLTHHALGQSRVCLPPFARALPSAPGTRPLVCQQLATIFRYILPSAPHHLFFAWFQSRLFHPPLEFPPSGGGVSLQTMFAQQ